MITETQVKMRKTNNPFIGTVKVCHRNGLVNVNHEKRVNRRMVESGLDPLYVTGETWYVHETTTEGKTISLCQSKKDNNVKYLQYFPHRNLSTKYRLNGRELTQDEVVTMKTFIPVVVTKEFKEPVITLKMESIKTIKFRRLNFSK